MSHTPGEKTYLRYPPQGVTHLPASNETVIVFDTATQMGLHAAPHSRCYWLDVSITVSETGAIVGQQYLALERRLANGNYTNVVPLTDIPVGVTRVEYFVSPYQDWRLSFQNGVNPQLTTFDVEMVIDHTSRARQTA